MSTITQKRVHFPADPTTKVHLFERHLERGKRDDEFWENYELALLQEDKILKATLSLFQSTKAQLELLNKNYFLYAHQKTRTETLEIYKMISNMVVAEKLRLSTLNDILDSTIDKPRKEIVANAIKVAKRFIKIISYHQDRWLRAADIKELDEKGDLPSPANPFARLKQVESFEPRTRRYRLFTN